MHSVIWFCVLAQTSRTSWGNKNLGNIRIREFVHNPGIRVEVLRGESGDWDTKTATQLWWTLRECNNHFNSKIGLFPCVHVPRLCTLESEWQERMLCGSHSTHRSWKHDIAFLPLTDNDMIISKMPHDYVICRNSSWPSYVDSTNINLTNWEYSPYKVGRPCSHCSLPHFFFVTVLRQKAGMVRRTARSQNTWTTRFNKFGKYQQSACKMAFLIHQNEIHSEKHELRGTYAWNSFDGWHELDINGNSKIPTIISRGGENAYMRTSFRHDLSRTVTDERSTTQTCVVLILARLHGQETHVRPHHDSWFNKSKRWSNARSAPWPTTENLKKTRIKWWRPENGHMISKTVPQQLGKPKHKQCSWHFCPCKFRMNQERDDVFCGGHSEPQNESLSSSCDVEVDVRGFPPLCRFSRQSDSWWRCLSTGRAWKCAWCTGCSWSGSCCIGRAAFPCVVVNGRVNEENDVLVVNGKWDNNKRWDVCNTRDRFFSSAQRWNAIRVTWVKRVVCVPRLWTNCTQMCVVSGCPVYMWILSCGPLEHNVMWKKILIFPWTSSSLLTSFSFCLVTCGVISLRFRPIENTCSLAMRLEFEWGLKSNGRARWYVVLHKWFKSSCDLVRFGCSCSCVSPCCAWWTNGHQRVVSDEEKASTHHCKSFFTIILKIDSLIEFVE